MYPCIVLCHYNAVNFLANIHESHSPIKARYVVSFVDPASDGYFASVPVISYAIFYNVGLHYNCA